MDKIERVLGAEKTPYPSRVYSGNMALLEATTTPDYKIPVKQVKTPINSNMSVSGLSKSQVRQMVIDEFGTSSVMVKVAAAESGFSEKIKNPKSSAVGVFQILSGTAKLFNCGDRLNALENIKCARKIYDANGLKDWRASGDWKESK